MNNEGVPVIHKAKACSLWKLLQGHFAAPKARMQRCEPQKNAVAPLRSGFSPSSNVQPLHRCQHSVGLTRRFTSGLGPTLRRLGQG